MNSLYQTDVIYVNGVKMTQKEFKAMIAAKKKAAAPKRKKKAPKTEIQEMPSWIKTMIRNAGPIKSLAAYYDNAYKQWGNIAKTILQLPEIRSSFTVFRANAREMETLLNEITTLGKHNEKSIYAYIERLSWKLDDIKTNMDKLYGDVRNSGVIQQFSDKECINGVGKRLGLSILMDRTYVSINKLSKIIKELEQLVSQGNDIMKYNIYSKF